jgi:hypothetical protein
MVITPLTNSNSSLLEHKSSPKTPPNKSHRQSLLPYSPGELGKWVIDHVWLDWKTFFNHHQLHSTTPTSSGLFWDSGSIT